MYNVFDTEIFGVILTILFFNIGIYIQKKTNKPIFNPLLIAILGIILDVYKRQGQAWLY